VRAFLVLVGTALNLSLEFDTGRVNGIENFHKISKAIIINDTKVFCNGTCANIKWASKLILKDAITQVEPRYPDKIGRHQTSKSKH
jgi:hypothetical protein